MTTVASPVSIRDQALAIIAEVLTTEPALQMPLDEIGGAVLVELLCDLERNFDIGIDVDEILPNGTIAVLVELVVLRAQGAAAGPRIYHWYDERARRALPYVSSTALARQRLQKDPSEPEPETEPKPDPKPAPEPAFAEWDGGCAVPPDAAWSLYIEMEAREQLTSRRILGWIVFCAVVGAAAGGWWWSHVQGLR